MYHNYFETKIRFEKMDESGMNKKVTETNVFDALSFTEAEKRTIEEVGAYISGEYTVTDIKRAGYSEVHLCDDGGKFFSCRLAFITLDDKSGKERKTKQTMLVQASDFDHAKKRLGEIMDGTMADYTIDMIKETDIVEVYMHEDGKAESHKDE